MGRGMRSWGGGSRCPIIQKRVRIFSFYTAWCLLLAVPRKTESAKSRRIERRDGCGEAFQDLRNVWSFFWFVLPTGAYHVPYLVSEPEYESIGRSLGSRTSQHL